MNIRTISKINNWKMVSFGRSLVYQRLMHADCPMIGKYVIGTFLFSLMLFFSAPAWGQAKLTMHLTESDTTVEAQVVLQAPVKLGAILFSVNWDPLTLGYDGIQDLFDDVIPELTVGTVQANKGKVVFLWTSPFPLDNQFDFTEGLPLVTFRFRKIFPGPAYVFFNDDPAVIEIADLDNNQLEVETRTENFQGGIINGKVFWDANEDCTFILEKGIPRRMVELTEIRTGKLYRRITNDDGEFWFPVEDGTYRIRTFDPTGTWQGCNQDQEVTVAAGNAPYQFLGEHPVRNCTQLHVETAMLDSRPCNSTNLYVSYTNLGAVEAKNAQLWVILDPAMSLLQSSLPYESHGDTLYFNLGNLAPLEKYSQSLMVQVACDAVTGQTHCLQSGISADNSCSAGDWNEGVLSVQSECQGDSIVFYLRNVGPGDMAKPASFVITEDVVIFLKDDNVRLDQFAQEKVSIPTTAHTYRLEARQPDGYPGVSHTFTYKEGCPSVGMSSPGIITQFPMYDEELNYSRLCINNERVFIPNRKQSLPEGVGLEHRIDQHTQLSFTIQFQNTLQDTAHTVVILDTLSEWLDPRTIQVGPASHPFTYDLNENGVIRFVFSNVNLPGKSTDSPSSVGFITYTILPYENAPAGVHVQSRAVVYYDLKGPYLTNETDHLIKAQILDVVPTNPDAKYNGLQISVFPNPSQGEITLSVLNQGSLNDLEMEMVDPYGVKLWRQKMNFSTIHFLPEVRNTGMYFIRIYHEGKPVGVAKLFLLR